MIDERAAARVVERWRHRKFEYGIFDCWHFCAEFVDARLGTNYLTDVSRALPRYESPIEAVRLVNAAGGWEAIITKFLGPPSPLAEIEFGDVVLGHADPPLERTTVLGICDDDVIMATGSLGLCFFSMKNAIRGWKCRKQP